MRATRLSVVVPFRGAEETLEPCLEALTAQTYPPEAYEILLVDNNAVSRTSQIAQQFPRVRILRQSEPGPYTARNLGARETIGDVIVFTDADCTAPPDWLTRIAAAMDDPDIEILIGSKRPFGRSTVVELLAAYEEVKARHISGSSDPTLYVGDAGNMAVRRSTFARFGPFDDIRRGADTTFVRRVVDSRPCSVVRYDSALAVRHLEVVHARDYFRKVFVYGRSYRRYRQLSGARSLSSLERLRLFEETVRQERPPALGRLALATALAAGLCCWCAGFVLGR
jgi:glycosyltransferase involved in cell wall biosynthesis